MTEAYFKCPVCGWVDKARKEETERSCVKCGTALKLGNEVWGWRSARCEPFEHYAHVMYL